MTKYCKFCEQKCPRDTKRTTAILTSFSVENFSATTVVQDQYLSDRTVTHIGLRHYAMQEFSSFVGCCSFFSFVTLKLGADYPCPRSVFTGRDTDYPCTRVVCTQL